MTAVPAASPRASEPFPKSISAHKLPPPLLASPTSPTSPSPALTKQQLELEAHRSPEGTMLLADGSMGHPLTLHACRMSRHRVPSLEDSIRFFQHTRPPPPLRRQVVQNHLAESMWIFEDPESWRFGDKRRDLRPRPQKPTTIVRSRVPATSATAPVMIAAHKKGLAFEQEMARIRHRLHQVRSKQLQAMGMDRNILSHIETHPPREPCPSPMLRRLQ